MGSHSPVSLKLLAVVFVSAVLYGCNIATTNVEKKDPFALSDSHLNLTDAAPSVPVAPIPPLQSPQVFAELTKPKENLYDLSVVNLPVRQVLNKLARDAKVNLDIQQGVTGEVSLHVIQQPLSSILSRIADQVSLRVIHKDDTIYVLPDMPYWVNYPMDYVNLERYSSASMMLSNAVGNNVNKQSQSMMLGGNVTGNTPATSIQAGTSVAILNQTRHDVWGTLNIGLQRILRSMYPSLSGEASTASISVTQEKEPSLPALMALPNQKMPTPEKPLGQTSFAPLQPYPEGASVLNYINISREAGFVAVCAPYKAQKEIQKYIEMLRSGTRRQVMIEATVVEVELNDEHQAGINWRALADNATLGMTSTFSGRDQIDFTNAATAGLVTITGNSITKDFSLTSTIKLLQRFGNSKVLSSPKLVTINNQPSLLKVVKNVVYFSMQVQVIAGQTGQSSTRAYTSVPNTVPVGLVMSVLPSINEHNEITLVVRPTISSLSGTVDDPNPDLGSVPNRVPIIQEREMESVLKLHDGQVAILGGLIQDIQADEDTGVPGLVGTPVLGYLFGQKNAGKRKSELVVFLKPTLVNDQHKVNMHNRSTSFLAPNPSQRWERAGA